jgi:TolB-like protein
MTGGTLITKEGMTMGTIAYMSPEQAQGEEVDHRSDIWSLGVVLYEMFGGQMPFKGEQDQAVVYSILNKRPKPLAELRSEIPESIGQVVDKALEKNPDERYQRIDELLDDLKSISAGIVPEEIKVRLRKTKLRRRKRTILYTCAAGLVIAMVVIALNLFMGGRLEAIESIAVLPFENLTGDAGQEYFVDGATDEVISQLSKIGAWNVISRTSVMQYKGVEKPLSEIARELNVDAVVEGTVYKTGESVRIGAKLIDVFPEEQNLWADTYDRPMTEVRIMYSEIASTIADKTQVDLTAEEMTRLTSASQVNPESYDNWLKGWLHLDKHTPEWQKIAMQYFDLALEIDADNALAYVGIANVWSWRYQTGWPRQEAKLFYKEAIDKALEIDNALAEAYSILAAYRCFAEWDWENAEKESKQALRLNPNDVVALTGRSLLLCFKGRTEEALPHMELALELDPLNPLRYHFYGQVLRYNRRYDDAIAAFRTASEIEPNLGMALSGLARSLGAKGMHDEALVIWRKRFADDPERTAALEDGVKEAGYKGAMRALADLMADWYGKPGKNVEAYGIAVRYLDAGEYDLAMDWYEKAYEDHNPNLPYIGGPKSDPLRSYPRFQELLRKMNLPVDEKEIKR